MIYLTLSLAFNIFLYAMNGHTHKGENGHAISINKLDITVENLAQARLILKQLRNGDIVLKSDNDQYIKSLLDQLSSLLMPNYREKKLVAYIMICGQINKDLFTEWLKNYIANNPDEMKNVIDKHLELFFVSDSIEEINYIHDLGISYNAKDREKRNMLMLAIFMCATKITKHLLANYCKFEINIFDQDIKNNSALYYAIKAYDEVTALKLTDLGLEPQNQTEKKGIDQISAAKILKRVTE